MGIAVSNGILDQKYSFGKIPYREKQIQEEK